jgi:hypothetical protein
MQKLTLTHTHIHTYSHLTHTHTCTHTHRRSHACAHMYKFARALLCTRCFLCPGSWWDGHRPQGQARTISSQGRVVPCVLCRLQLSAHFARMRIVFMDYNFVIYGAGCSLSLCSCTVGQLSKQQMRSFTGCTPMRTEDTHQCVQRIYTNAYASTWSMDATYLGLARNAKYLICRVDQNQCVYGIFGRKITKYTVIYGVYVRFWPTLLIWLHTEYFSC